MDRDLLLAPSPAPLIAPLLAASSGSSFAMILSALLIVATIMGVMAFCVWLCGCKPEDVIRARAVGSASISSGASSSGSSSATKMVPGMSKQAMESALPAMSYGAAAALLASLKRSSKSAVVELGCCSICLAEFGKLDESIRVMPSCGHCFHSDCIAMWLVAHSSCPVCRRSLIHCCKNCGRITAASSSPSPAPPPPPPPQPSHRDLSFSEAVACYSTQDLVVHDSRTIRLDEVVIEVPAEDEFLDRHHL